MGGAIAAVVVAYAIGSVPVAWLTGRALKGIDIRAYGSGNVGASNVFQAVSRSLVVPVGLAQIAQGASGPLVARALDAPSSAQVAAGLAAVVAHNWNPWLRLSGGRGVGPAIGFLLVLSPFALAAFIVVSVAGVLLRAIPQGVAAAMLSAPVVAGAAGDGAAVVTGCVVLAALVLLKRVLANGAPDARYERPRVWLTRLVYDRDDPDRDAWVRRNLDDLPAARP